MVFVSPSLLIPRIKMAERISDKIQTADWKGEKHVPVIDCPDRVGAGKNVSVTVAVGKEIAHPNTTEHHIRWIRAYFVPEGGTFAIDVGNFEFNAQVSAVALTAGASADAGYSHGVAVFTMAKGGLMYEASVGGQKFGFDAY